MGSDIVANQQQTPADLSFNGGQWKRLFSVAAFSGDLTVEVDASQANGQVAVDGLFVAEIQDGGVPESNQYDNLGELVASVDDKGQSTGYSYDELGRRMSVLDARGGTTAFAYDLLGRQIGIKDPSGNVTRFGYNAGGQTTQEQTFGIGGGTRAYDYDAAGNQILSVDRDGRATRVTYDPLNRPVDESWYADANTTSPLRTYSYAYDKASRLLGAGDNSVYATYDYDALDRMRNEEWSGLGTPVHLYHDYPTRKDALRQFVNVSLGGIQDSSTEFTYDGNGQMLSLRQTGGGLGRPIADKYVSFSYTPSGQFGTISRYEAQWADPAKLVAQSQYAYDGRNQLTGLVHAQGPSNMLAQYTWTYDALGRITNQTSKDGTAEYGYDQTGQLTSAKYNYTGAGQQPVGAGLPTVPPDQTFSYDANGNWDSSGHTTGSNNQPDSDGTYTYQYDPEGNRTRRTEIATGDYTEYLWDHRNRLTGVIQHDADDAVLWSVSYQYDYLNRLVTRTETVGAAAPVTEHFAYDGDQMILQLDANGQVEHRYLWGPAVDQLLADESIPSGSSSSIVRWGLGDQLNSTRDLATLDSANHAAIVDHIIYDAFGRDISESSPSNSTDLKFTGHFTDPQTGLQWNLNRWYDSGLHQWLSLDPILFEAGDPNPRRYVHNDPVNRVDPRGLDDWHEKPTFLYIYGWITGTNDDSNVAKVADEDLGPYVAPPETAAAAVRDALVEWNDDWERRGWAKAMDYTGVGALYWSIKQLGTLQDMTDVHIRGEASPHYDEVIAQYKAIRRRDKEFADASADQQKLMLLKLFTREALEHPEQLAGVAKLMPKTTAFNAQGLTQIELRLAAQGAEASVASKVNQSPFSVGKSGVRTAPFTLGEIYELKGPGTRLINTNAPGVHLLTREQLLAAPTTPAEAFLAVPQPAESSLRSVVRFLREEGVASAEVRRSMIEQGFGERIGPDTPVTLDRFRKLFPRTMTEAKEFSGKLGDIETRVATLNEALAMERSGLRVRFEFEVSSPSGSADIDLIGRDPLTDRPIRVVQLIRAQPRAGGRIVFKDNETRAAKVIEEALGREFPEFIITGP